MPSTRRARWEPPASRRGSTSGWAATRDRSLTVRTLGVPRRTRKVRDVTRGPHRVGTSLMKPQRQILVTVSGLMLVMLLASLDQTIVSTALPTIVGDLGGLEHLSWVVTAYLLAVTVVTPLYGKLGDLYGRKVVLQAALVLFLIGSALCGLAPGLTEL